VRKIAKLLLKYTFLLVVGGFTYYGIELLYRGRSHWTMFILGGICFIYCGLQNEIMPNDKYPLWKQVLYSDIFVIIAEFITGCIVNIHLGWNVWDYSNLPLNLLGQSCPQFALLFMPVCLFAIILDDVVRYIFFDEDISAYRLF
jgi:uncharacterized membrane protein